MKNEKVAESLQRLLDKDMPFLIKRVCSAHYFFKNDYGFLADLFL